MKNELLLSADGSDLLSYPYIPISIFFDLTLNSEKGRGAFFLRGKYFLLVTGYMFLKHEFYLFLQYICCFFISSKKILYLVYWEVYN